MSSYLAEVNLTFDLIVVDIIKYQLSIDVDVIDLLPSLTRVATDPAKDRHCNQRKSCELSDLYAIETK